MDLLSELSDLYSNFKSEVNIPIELQKRLSAPLLLYPTERWIKSENKILVVGQETAGWGVGGENDKSIDSPPIYKFDEFLTEEDSVEALMHGYKDWAFAFDAPHTYSSPFWQAYRRIRKHFDENVDGIESTVLWKNLFPADLDDGSVYNNSNDEVWETIKNATKGLLSDEIQLLKPNAVIFFTGHYYDSALTNEFEGLEFNKFGEYEIKQAAWLNHPSLPPVSMRTYHPKPLNMQLPQLLDEVEQAIVSGLNTG